MATKLINGIRLEMTAEEVAKLPQPPTSEQITYALAEEVRTERDTLLTASDWTQVADAPVDQTAWATYRQSLRDVPTQEGFPDNITWPTPPS